MRINSASDDAAGLGISMNLSANIRSMAQAQRNANDGISMTQVAEGSMNDMQGIVTRLRELAVQSANATLGSDERGYIQTEATQLTAEIDRISTATSFNGAHLLDATGGAAGVFQFQVGINNVANVDQISMTLAKVDSTTLGLATMATAGAATLSTVAGAQAAIGLCDAAIKSLSSARANVGAVQNRMTVVVSNLAMTQQNLSAANSRIMDVDVASESSNLTKSQILSQAGLAVLAQANSLPQSALKLLQ
jgi:flagellin